MIGKPNEWLIKHHKGGDAEGYIINKELGGRQVGLTKIEFEQDIRAK